MAFGRYMNTVYRPEKAEVILSLDSDFMASGPGHIRYMKQFYRRRKLDNDAAEMNRLYVVEPTPSVTGATRGSSFAAALERCRAVHAGAGGENWIGWNDGTGSRGAALDGYGSRGAAATSGLLRW